MRNICTECLGVHCPRLVNRNVYALRYIIGRGSVVYLTKWVFKLTPNIKGISLFAIVRNFKESFFLNRDSRTWRCLYYFILSPIHHWCHVSRYVHLSTMANIKWFGCSVNYACSSGTVNCVGTIFLLDYCTRYPHSFARKNEHVGSSGRYHGNICYCFYLSRLFVERRPAQELTTTRW